MKPKAPLSECLATREHSYERARSSSKKRVLGFTPFLGISPEKNPSACRIRSTSSPGAPKPAGCFYQRKPPLLLPVVSVGLSLLGQKHPVPSVQFKKYFLKNRNKRYRWNIRKIPFLEAEGLLLENNFKNTLLSWREIGSITDPSRLPSGAATISSASHHQRQEVIGFGVVIRCLLLLFRICGGSKLFLRVGRSDAVVFSLRISRCVCSWCPFPCPRFGGVVSRSSG